MEKPGLEIPGFLAFHDHLTGRWHAVPWGEAVQAFARLTDELGRLPSRDELLTRLVDGT